MILRWIVWNHWSGKSDREVVGIETGVVIALCEAKIFLEKNRRIERVMS
jgi:hypothetical protein